MSVYISYMYTRGCRGGVRGAAALPAVKRFAFVVLVRSTRSEAPNRES